MIKRAALFVCATAFLAGCAAVGPDFEKPAADVPERWAQAESEAISTSPYEHSSSKKHT